MKKYALMVLPVLILAAGICAFNRKGEKPVAPAPVKSNYIFTVIKELPVLPVTSQGRSGTCWSFATTSLLEAEIIRIKGEKIKLSEMYFVRGAYRLKAQNYILRQGTARFTEGGLGHDPVLVAAAFGLVPQSAYSGLTGGNKEHDHAKMAEVLTDTVKRYADAAKKPGTGWKTEVPLVLDRFMGEAPAEFQYEGKMYTPESFLAFTQLHPDDYVTITSFSHAPFYRPFVMSIPANWADERFYNLPLDELIANIDHAIEAGFTLSLDLDGTEPAFTAEIGVIPEKEGDIKICLTDPRPEKNITQQMRQDAFEQFNTTDDHLVHIMGIVKDQHGNRYYKTKNSWGPKAGREGFLYLSVAYMRMKGISVLLHKDGLMEETRGKLFK